MASHTLGKLMEFKDISEEFDKASFNIDDEGVEIELEIGLTDQGCEIRETVTISYDDGRRLADFLHRNLNI